LLTFSLPLKPRNISGEVGTSKVFIHHWTIEKSTHSAPVGMVNEHIVASGIYVRVPRLNLPFFKINNLSSTTMKTTSTNQIFLFVFLLASLPTMTKVILMSRRQTAGADACCRRF
jgi:hypothetical protein